MTGSTNYATLGHPINGPTTSTPPTAQYFHQTSTETQSDTDWVVNSCQKQPHATVAADLDVQCNHAGCCATAEATRGH
ncbi:MAG: hypothetical protein ACKPKO_41985, partial [Candidatus Fonsibacter sp.]